MTVNDEFGNDLEWGGFHTFLGTKHSPEEIKRKLRNSSAEAVDIGNRILDFLETCKE
jgi:hypothetical protein